MVQESKQLNGGDRMEKCFIQRRRLAKKIKQYQKVFVALGDENRQQIFLVLLENDQVGMRVPEITKRTHLSRPAVSHHLRILKDAGLIECHRQGTRNYYYVDTAEDFWNGLNELTNDVRRIIFAAKENGYPNFEED